MKLPAHKTKIVCTIGPASSSQQVLEEMIENGMNVARINLSHGGPAEWAEIIENVRKASQKKQRVIGIFVDLPGAKIRVGKINNEPLVLKKGEPVTFAPAQGPLAPGAIPIEYPLADSVAKGGKIYLNDGFIELKVDEVAGSTVRCSVVTGGPLTSHKGVNLPGAKLYIEPITERDLELVGFALDHDVDMIGISFVTKAADVLKVKQFAQERGKQIFAIAKIELGTAVNSIDEILNVTDAIMLARGDLGVEMPIEEVPLIQKKLIAKANLLGRPVITATQMLESMKNNTRPTRAEVSDVANAILDGTDAVMLSEETAMGAYPVETVRMMASIAAAAEAERRTLMTNFDEELRWYLKALAEKGKLTVPDVISRNSVVAAEVLGARYIITPTDTGGTPRRVSRYKPDAWILAFSSQPRTCRRLSLSYGVYSFQMEKQGASWHAPVTRFLKERGLIELNDQFVLAEGGFSYKPGETDSLQVVKVDKEMLESHA